MIRSALLVAVLASLAPFTAWGFEPVPTHPGLTGRAVIQSRLHTFLHRECGWRRGLFEQLRLDPGPMSRRRHKRLTRDLLRLDPAGGYRPDEKTGLRAVGWCLAGSVLAQRPASRGRHHFFCPPLRTGLDDRGPLVGSFLALLAMLEGSDTVREFFTGTGFDLTGKPAPAWVTSSDNDLSIPVLYDHLARSVTAEHPPARRHHLAVALLAMGGVLHVLQDMASPTHVRNDFRVGHLQRLGSSSFNRGSAFERYVADRFGQFGLTPGEPVEKRRIADFFSNEGWTGLADITSISHFSPGTLPPPTLVLPDTDVAELRRRLSGKLKLKKPALGPLDLRCARTPRRCYLKGPHGPLLAYHIDDQRRLRFTLDRRCHAAAARHLLPLAIGYSAGLINHLLRGRVELGRATEKRDADLFSVKNLGAPIKEAKGELLAEDKKGRRTRVRALELSLPAKTGDALAAVSFTPPADAVAMVVLIRGRGPEGDPLLATARLSLEEEDRGRSETKEE